MTARYIPPGDTAFVFNQVGPANPWIVTHFLDKHPSVTVVDSSGNVVVGDIVYDSPNQVTITFSGPFSGKAFLN